MPGLLDTPPLDLAGAHVRLSELRTRGRQLAALALTLALIGGGLLLGRASAGIPLLIGAAASASLYGLTRADRRRLLVALIAQGDAWALEPVRLLAERLVSRRERGRLARGLRDAAAAGAPGTQAAMLVDPPRVADVAPRLLALADRIADPVARVPAPAAALCRRLLCDARHSPLYNPQVPEGDLYRVLDLVEGQLL